MIYFKCPGCDGKYEMGDDLAGRKMECAHCKLKFAVPNPDKKEDFQVLEDGSRLQFGTLLERSGADEVKESPKESVVPEAPKYPAQTTEQPAYVSELERQPQPIPPPSQEADAPQKKKKALKVSGGRSKRRRNVVAKKGGGASFALGIVLIVLGSAAAFVYLRRHLEARKAPVAVVSVEKKTPAPADLDAILALKKDSAWTKPAVTEAKPVIADGLGYPDAAAYQEKAATLWQKIMGDAIGWKVPLANPRSLHLYSQELFPLLIGEGPDGPDVQAVAGKTADGNRIILFSSNEVLEAMLSAKAPEVLLPDLGRWLSGRNSASTIAVREGSSLDRFGTLVLPAPTIGIVGKNLAVATLGCDEKELAIVVKRLAAGNAGVLGVVEELEQTASGRELLKAIGVGVGDSDANVLAADMPNWPAFHACWAMQKAIDIEASRSGNDRAVVRQVSRTLLAGIRSNQDVESEFMHRVRDSLGAVPAPRGGHVPLSPWQQAVFAYEAQRDSASAGKETGASTFAKLFPGFGSAAPVDTRVVIDTGQPYWHGTGLYANPGESITVTIPRDAVARGLRLRIGSHSYEPSVSDSWYRAATLGRGWELDEERVVVSSSVGGMIVVEVPGVVKGRTAYQPPFTAMLQPASAGASVELQIQGAIPAPVFDANDPDVETFVAQVQANSAPFCEIRSSEIVFMIPTLQARGIAKPDALLSYWHGVLGDCREMVGVPRDQKPPFPLVVTIDLVDAQPAISYPVHWPIFTADRILKPDLARQGGSGALLAIISGYYAQAMGQVIDDPQVAGMILAMAFVDKRGGGSPRSIHPMLDSTYDARYVQRIFARRGKLEGGSVFERVQPFCMLADNFGVEALMSTFAAYAGASAKVDAADPKLVQHDFIIRLSLSVEKNLFPFFRCWGYRTNGRISDRILQYDVWMPAGFPDKYVVIQ